MNFYVRHFTLVFKDNALHLSFVGENNTELNSSQQKRYKVTFKAGKVCVSVGISKLVK